VKGGRISGDAEIRIALKKRPRRFEGGGQEARKGGASHPEGKGGGWKKAN